MGKPFVVQTALLAASVWEDSVPESWGQVLLAPTLPSHTEAMPELVSLGEQQWPCPLPLAYLLSRSLAWEHSLWMPLADTSLALSTGLACGRQRLCPGQHLATPQPFLPH